MKRTNPVAKYARKYNLSTVEVDRKKEAKKDGFSNKKHKKSFTFD